MKKIPYFIIIALVLLSVYQCNERRAAENRLVQVGKNHLQSVQHYKNALGTVSARSKALEFTEKELRQTISDTVQKLLKGVRNVRTVVQTKVVASPPIEKIVFSEPLPCDSTFTRTGAVFTKNYEFGYKITRDSLSIEPFSTSAEATLVIGQRRKWFLGKSENVAELTFSNPTWSVQTLQVINVKNRKPFYDTRLFNILVGAALGAAVSR